MEDGEGIPIGVITHRKKDKDKSVRGNITKELIYPVALKSGYVATLRLPVELTRNDAIRISNLVQALARPEPPDA